MNPEGTTWWSLERLTQPTNHGVPLRVDGARPPSGGARSQPARPLKAFFPWWSSAQAHASWVEPKSSTVRRNYSGPPSLTLIALATHSREWVFFSEAEERTPRSAPSSWRTNSSLANGVLHKLSRRKLAPA